MPAGGGGGRGPTRELFDTLLLWKPSVVLDANGEATVEVPLNDSLTSFRIVAVADAGAGMFGTGSTTHPRHAGPAGLAGLPPLVREGDQFSAQLTLRNTTAQRDEGARPRRARTLLALRRADACDDRRPAKRARSPGPCTAPASAGARRAAEAILWEIEAARHAAAHGSRSRSRQRIAAGGAADGAAGDAGAARRHLHAAIARRRPTPCRRRAQARRPAASRCSPSWPRACPACATASQTYPFICLEQKTCKSVGLQRRASCWAAVVAAAADLPRQRRPGRTTSRRATARPTAAATALTAYLLAATHEAARSTRPSPARRGARADGARPDRLRRRPHPARVLDAARKDLDVRKLAALEALSRYGKAQRAHARQHHHRAQPVADRAR